MERMRSVEQKLMTDKNDSVGEDNDNYTENINMNNGSKKAGEAPSKRKHQSKAGEVSSKRNQSATKDSTTSIKKSNKRKKSKTNEKNVNNLECDPCDDNQDGSVPDRNNTNDKKSFDTWYQYLIKYRKANGHSNPSYSTILNKGSKNPVGLGRWASSIRVSYAKYKKTGVCSKDRHVGLYEITKLQKIDFNFKYNDNDNQEITDVDDPKNFEDLALYNEQYGHMNVPESHKLYTWIKKVRDLKADNKLSAISEVILNQMKFPWKESMNVGLFAYIKAKNDGQNIIAGHPSYKWCQDVRKKYEQKELEKGELALLRQCEFNFDGGSDSNHNDEHNDDQDSPHEPDANLDAEWVDTNTADKSISDGANDRQNERNVTQKAGHVPGDDDMFPDNNPFVPDDNTLSEHNLLLDENMVSPSNSSDTGNTTPSSQANPKEIPKLLYTNREGYPLVKCDFCKKMDTNHYCFEKCTQSEAQFRNSSGDFICGKASCLQCKEKAGMEDETKCIVCYGKEKSSDKRITVIGTSSSSSENESDDEAPEEKINYTEEELKKKDTNTLRAMCVELGLDPGKLRVAGCVKLILDSQK